MGATLVLLAAALFTGACRPASKPLAETDANGIADATVAAWTSMDSARIKAMDAPANDGPIRCTDVFHKDARGDWPIVDEHCSIAARPA